MPFVIFVSKVHHFIDLCTKIIIITQYYYVQHGGPISGQFLYDDTEWPTQAYINGSALFLEYR